eukprot:TRINITY_DN14247_c0_g1_i1.p1 TRINITY_DN14247_c0_g1~~TRINITY_DN14247_c0_g1_i1.p1  ORF type:complete len:147 (-),score=34.95 TRINITY_DN14247_c0_g1_i1:62-502(-)
MSTRASASSVFPHNIDKVWKLVSDFTFPSQFSTIESVNIQDNKGRTEVGAVRLVKWKSGEEQKQRLLALSELDYYLSWETVEANHETESSAKISTIRLYRITENDHTLVVWSSDFSSDINYTSLNFERKAYQQNLSELRDAVNNTK